MESHNQKTLLEEALNYLSYAEAELSRPQEDVVTYCACHFTRKSVSDLLKAFLVMKKKKPAKDATLDDLYKLCITIEPGFEAVDISTFNCMDKCDNPGDEKYCLSVDHVTRCYAKANQIKELVINTTELKTALQQR